MWLGEGVVELNVQWLMAWAGGGVSVVYIHMLVLWERGDCSKLNVYAHEQEGELAKSTKSERMCLMDFLQVARR